MLKPIHLWRRQSLRFKTWLRYGRLYRSEMNPYRVMWVDPGEIDLMQEKNLIRKDDIRVCHVIGGDWDLRERKFVDRTHFQVLKQRFADRIQWNEMAFIDLVRKRISERGQYWNGCSSEDDIQARCVFLDKLYAEIKENGYNVPKGVKPGVSGISLASTPDEVAVSIGRDGRFFFVTGRHRLTIAKILGLHSIPVRVVVRHAEWQSLRDQFYTSSTEQQALQFRKYSSHPDMAYLAGVK